MRRSIILLVLLMLAVSASYAISTSFWYEGTIKGYKSEPISGLFDLQVSLYTAPTGGTQLGTTKTLCKVPVSSDHFETLLDFGDGGIFNGQDRWLQISVRLFTPLLSFPYKTLPTRLLVYSAPYTLTAANALKLNGFTAADFWQLGGNTVAATGVLGTKTNFPLNVIVNNSRALRIEPTTDSPNIIGGFSGNAVAPGTIGATISGGGLSTHPNSISGTNSFIGGGARNEINAEIAVIAGGFGNKATKDQSTVGGGVSNTASNLAATVGGGAGNEAAGASSVVAGGGSNKATGNFTAIGGGFGNTAGGQLATTIAGGLFNQAIQSSATIPGGTLAIADKYGQLAYASGGFPDLTGTKIPGTAQTGLYVMRAVTSVNNPAELFLDGIGERLALTGDNTTWTMTVTVAAQRADANNTSLGFEFKQTVKRTSTGSVQPVGIPVVTLNNRDAGAAAWSITFDFDDATNPLRLIANSNGTAPTRWVARITTTEVSFVP